MNTIRIDCSFSSETPVNPSKQDKTYNKRNTDGEKEICKRHEEG
jgi:hypothetical protein